MLALQILTQPSRSEREVARKYGNAVVEDVDVRHFVADVYQTDESAHRRRIIELEGVVKGEGIDVDHARRHPRLGQNAKLRLDEITLRGDEQHAHLLAGWTVRIENLKIELDRFDVGDVLLRFPF